MGQSFALRGSVSIRDKGAIGTLNRLRHSIKGAMNAARGFAGPMQGLARSSRRMAHMQTAGGFGASFAAAGFLRSTYTMQSSLNTLQAQLDATDQSFKAMEARVVQVAKSNPKSISEIADGARELAMAGLPIKTVMSILDETAKGAVATGQKMSLIGGGVTDVIMSMRLANTGSEITGKKFAYVSNLMAAAQSSANQTYFDFLRGVAKTGPLASAAGMDIKLVAASLGVLANQGTKSTEGGIALRTMLLNVAATTPKARQALAGLKVPLDQFVKKSGQFKLNSAGLISAMSEIVDLQAFKPQLDQILSDKGLQKDASMMSAKIMSVIGAGLSGSDAESRKLIADGIARTVRAGAQSVDILGLLRSMTDKGAGVADYGAVFGKRQAARAAGLAAALKSGAFREVYEGIESKAPGAVNRRYKIMQKGFVGAVNRMAASWNAFLKVLADTGVMDEISKFLQGVTALINRLGNSNPTLLKFGVYAVLAAGVLAPLGLALSGIAGMFNIAGLAAGGLMAIFGIGLPVFLAIAAVAALILYSWEHTGNGIMAVLTGIGNMFMGFAKFLYGLITLDMATIVEGMGQVWTGLFGGLGGVLDIAAGLLKTFATWFKDTWVGDVMESVAWVTGKISEFFSWLGGSSGPKNIKAGRNLQEQLSNRESSGVERKHATLDVKVTDTRTTAKFDQKTASPMFNKVNLNTGASMQAAR